MPPAQQEKADDLLRQIVSELNAGNLPSALRLSRSVLEFDPDNSICHFALAISHLQNCEFEKADMHFRTVLIQEPDSYNALYQLSVVNRELGRLDDAIGFAERAVSVDRGRPEASLSLGSSLIVAGRPEEAANCFRNALNLRPDLTVAHYQLGNALRLSGDHRGAALAYGSALELNPSVPAFHVAAGQIALDFDQIQIALDHAEQALELASQNVDALNLKSQALSALGRASEAERCMIAALAADDRSAVAHLNIGMNFEFKGDFAKAKQHLETALSFDGNLACAYLSLAQLETFTSPDHPLIGRMQEALKEPGPNDALIHYALGKAREDLKDFEQAMFHFDEANRLSYPSNRARTTWDPAAYENARLKAKETSPPESSETSELPIFIVGMIRSGTTLTEQILSCHPEIGAAGEVGFWKDSADRYLDLIRSFDPNAKRVTDKYPANFRSLGLIHGHLPNARIIHVRRNPVDTCLSIWTTHMSRGPAFANDRDDIVFAYRQYLLYMEHWRSVIPTDRLLEIDYEELVSNPEPIARKMIEFVGLDWQPDCLNPEKNRRAVSTPSLWRVRKPIDRSSVEKWRRYEPWLGAFAELLQAA